MSEKTLHKINKALDYWPEAVLRVSELLPTIEQEKRILASSMDHRFGADRRKCEEYEQHQAQVADADRKRRAEFSKREEK